MKKLISLFLMCMIFCSCNYDLYSGKRPFDYEDATWVCEEPSAWFTIDRSKDEYYYPEGVIYVDGEEVPIKLFFVHETNKVLFQLNKTGYSDKDFDGECEFSPEKLTINIYKDTLFDGEYATLVFVRQEATTE